jgi:glycosyltransferase involved in cell wall biosynthesis
LPIVSSDLASTRPFVLNGENGYLVTADDPAAHAEALSKLLVNSAEAQNMGLRGQKLVQDEYNWGKMEKRLLTIYETLLSR